MRYILILIFTVFFLFAKDEGSCYSVQLNSFVIKEGSSYKFDAQGYPQGCVLISTSKMNSVRCGCDEGYSKAKVLLDELRDKYQDASIVTTYKSRFEQNTNSPVSEVSSDDQELKLLFQVFSYTSDLENAYITAQKAIELYPESLYWHQKMAEVSKWTDRREDTISGEGSKQPPIFIFKNLSHDRNSYNRFECLNLLKIAVHSPPI